MAGQYDNTNKGVLFPNDRKQDGDNRPDYTGKMDIDGVEYFISAWHKQGRKGPFLSLARQKDRPQGQGPGGQQQRSQPRVAGRQPPAEKPFNEDDIPF